MAFGGQPFAIRRAMGEWAENSVKNYFNTNPDVGILAFPYGEKWGGTRRKETDAANRPDLLLIETDNVNALSKSGIDVSKLDLTTLSDSNPQLRSIIRKALVALEVKISIRYYVKGHVNFIIDEVRKAHYETWLKQTGSIGDVVTWFTFDKAFITTMDTVLTDGKKDKRTYENVGRTARVKDTWNLPVEATTPFADVTNVDLNRTLRARMKRGTTGGISFEVVDDLAVLENVNIAVLRKFAEETKRLAGISESSRSETDRTGQQRL